MGSQKMVGINRLMKSSLSRLTSTKLLFLNTNLGWSRFAYGYHLVNGISKGLAQSDPIKRRLLKVIQWSPIIVTSVYVIIKVGPKW